MTDPLTALRAVPAPPLDAAPVHARIDALAMTKRRRRRKLPALSAAAIVAAATAVVLTTGGTPTATQPVAATAATVLHALGEKVRPVELGAGEYYAARVRQFRPTGDGRSVDIRTWLRGDEGRELAIVDGKTKRDVTYAEARRGMAALPDPATFPTEPKALAARLRAETMKSQIHPGTEPTARDYVIFATLMVFGAKPTPPDVLRGIYDFLGTLPGIRLIGDVKDPLGRPGKAVAVNGDANSEFVGVELILAPDTGLPLATIHYRDNDIDQHWLYTTRQEGVVKGTDALPG